MEDFFKELGSIILGIIFIGIIVWFIMSLDNKANSEKAVKNRTFTEWVSPDGVHYWYETGSYGESWLAPRIDKDGNFVIDK